jgi:hypothetical protein
MNVQKAVRSFSNLYGYAPSQSVTDLQMRVIGLGKFVESTPVRPSTGIYTYGQTFGADMFPRITRIGERPSAPRIFSESTSGACVPDSRVKFTHRRPS